MAVAVRVPVVDGVPVRGLPVRVAVLAERVRVGLPGERLGDGVAVTEAVREAVGDGEAAAVREGLPE